MGTPPFLYGVNMITSSPKNILIADDSVFFRTKLSSILADAGHNVQTVDDGKEVIEALTNSPQHTDFLILDLQMPNTDGFEVLRWINNRKEKLTLSIMVITGVYEPTEIVDKLKELGAEAFMTKGFSPEQVVCKINNLLFPEHKIQRTHDRTPVSIPVDFVVAKECYTGFILNINTEGIFLHTNKPLKAKQEILVQFSLDEEKNPMSLKGEVVWVTPSKKQENLFNGAGVIFSSISEENKDSIKKMVSIKRKKFDIF
jgi:uncharacterized protein (TIGR02266 family)